MISEEIQAVVRDIYDFPKPGIVFKDVTPIFKDAELCTRIVDEFVKRLKNIQVDAVAGVESRGFLFGLMLANRLSVPFIPVRKPGKLPFTIVRKSYSLEYGSATIEMHTDAFEPGSKIFVHDDLLATGGTAVAASELIQELGGEIVGFGFVINLSFLKGEEKLRSFSSNVINLTSY